MRYIRKAQGVIQFFVGLIILLIQERYVNWLLRSRVKKECEGFDSFYEYWDFYQSIQKRRGAAIHKILLELMEPYILNFHQCMLVLNEKEVTRTFFKNLLEKAKGFHSGREEEFELINLISSRGLDGLKNSR
jgi:hypothetical protein